MITDVGHRTADGRRVCMDRLQAALDRLQAREYLVAQQPFQVGRVEQRRGRGGRGRHLHHLHRQALHLGQDLLHLLRRAVGRRRQTPPD